MVVALDLPTVAPMNGTRSVAFVLLLPIIGAPAVVEAAATMAPGDALSRAWNQVAGQVQSVQGKHVTVRRADGAGAIIDVGGFDLDVTSVLRPGRDVVMYGPARADGTIIGRGLQLEYTRAARGTRVAP
jgi:hypothetical protein